MWISITSKVLEISAPNSTTAKNKNPRKLPLRLIQKIDLSAQPTNARQEYIKSEENGGTPAATQQDQFRVSDAKYCMHFGSKYSQNTHPWETILDLDAPNQTILHEFDEKRKNPVDGSSNASSADAK